MKIHILTDNRVNESGLLAEHGLSVFIEHKDMNILFDTGQSGVYYHNAIMMDVDLSRADCIVLSHGHYDHCGGLVEFPCRMPKIYLHADAIKKKYAKDGTDYKDVGIPWSPDDGLVKNNLVFNHHDIEIAPGVTLHGDIPCTVSFEGVSKRFFTGSGDDYVQDTMNDEQMLIFEQGSELIVFLGCSHPGIINCLEYARSLFPGKKINTVLAGMHLGSAGPERIAATISRLRDLSIKRVIPMHCTGLQAICEIKRALGEKCLPLCTGDVLEI